MSDDLIRAMRASAARSAPHHHAGWNHAQVMAICARVAELEARIARATDIGSNGEHSADEYLMGEVLDALGANDG